MIKKPRFIDEDVFTFIYLEAMNDATRRTDAASIKKNILELEDVKNAVCAYAEAIIAGVANEDSFKKCVEEIEDVLRDNKYYNQFTFGNIQKLINMTMKYLYIKYRDTDEAAGFNLCHAPMDALMIKKVRKAARAAGIMEPHIDAECAWSRIKRESKNSKYAKSNYDSYQETITKLLKRPKIKAHCKNHLDFDYKYWGEETIDV